MAHRHVYTCFFIGYSLMLGHAMSEFYLLAFGAIGGRLLAWRAFNKAPVGIRCG